MQNMLWLLLIVGVTSVACSPLIRGDGEENPIDPAILEDASMSTMELVAKYGYEGETYTLQTEDGYLLGVHRVRPSSKCAEIRPIPVILQHGLLSSSADWVVMGPGKGLAYILADNCYDVWMGNSRGNTHSKNHTHFEIHSDEFWDFSWHEMGLYDITSLIDLVLMKTGHKNLYYVGHSQGTTQFFVMASMKPEYNDKIRAMFALAPIAHMRHAQSTFLTKIAKFEGIIGWAADALGIGQLLPSNDFIQEAGETLCNDNHPNSQNVCSNLLFAIAGYDEAETNKTMLPVIMGHTPAGSSTKQVLHYAQLINDKENRFRMYDYGNKENQNRYGSKTPPDYPIDKITTPVALVYSPNDFFAAEEDVDVLYKSIKVPLGKFRVSWEEFNHLDYLWAIHAKEYCYDRVLDIMNRGL